MPLRYPYKVALCFALFALLLVSLPAQEAHQVRVAMVGNSITFGSGLPNPSADCYPAQLQDLLTATHGDTVQIRNFGVSGRSMLMNTERPIWNEIQFRNALQYVPDICVILLGTNDSKDDFWLPNGQAAYLADYLSMIDTFQYRNPDTRFILCYPPPAFPDNPFGMNNIVIENEIIPSIDTVAISSGARLMDFHYPFVDSTGLFLDGIHPNLAGAGVMADMMYALLIDSSTVDQVDPGLAFASVFKQWPAIVPVGGTVRLEWETIFADSVFLDGELVDLSGSMELVAEAERVYTLTVKGPRNTVQLPLTLYTYVVNNVEELEDTPLKVYPNPVQDRLFLEAAEELSGELHLQVFGSSGQVVLEQRTGLNEYRGSRTLSVDLRALPAGTYTYAFFQDQVPIYGQFIKL